MSITYEENIKFIELDDILDEIQDVYGYIFARVNDEIQFLIENNWIIAHVDGLYVNVIYNSQNNMFERICSRFEIKILDDDSIYLRCFNGDRLVSSIKIM